MSDDWIKDIQKINKDAELLSNSKLGNISEWISTGSMAFNSVLSGSLFKGIPAGRVTCVMGEPSTGKSFLAGRLAANAQKIGYDVIYFDSENAITNDFLKNLGVNTKKLIYIPVVSIEDFKNQTVKLLNLYEEKYFESSDKKLFIILDSLGNMPAEKELADANNSHNASDMGLRAKIIKGVTRVLTSRLAKFNIPLFITNHMYYAPAMNPMSAPTPIPQGGKGVVYLSTILALLSKSKEREDNPGGKGKVLTGNKLKVETTKNRIIPEGRKSEMIIDFKKGPDKYYGLLDAAVKYGLIIKDGRKYKFTEDGPKYWERELYDGSDNGVSSDELWMPILEKLDEALQNDSDNQFSSISDDYDNEKELLLESSEVDVAAIHEAGEIQKAIEEEIEEK